MTDPAPLRGWDAFRPLDLLANTGVAAAYKTMFITLRQLVVGRRLTVRVGSPEDGILVLTVTRFSSEMDLRRLAWGGHHDVRLEATDISWRDYEFNRADVTLHNLHFRGSLRPTELVASPVELTLELPTPALDDLFRWAAPRLSGEVGPDGIARLHFAKRRGSGHVEVDARLDGSTLWVTPRAVVRRRRWILPARTPSYRVRLPELPNGLQLTSIDFAPGIVRLTGTLPEWRTDMPRTRLEGVIGQLSVVGRPLSLIWSGATDSRR
ncbi:hypothetical protein [Mycolicibacterium hodleri]|uniref:DUF2993 domain-containing protein n=1 Tax=Mycolicibacterium hodleri TaxID=49897 RepID=A0A502E7P5_9MYCO|nr:hypothetical protein [Mycolicibacterium hodleri]TPG33765.1 hypothetical protein EAH80_16145 [Mycolicibacterium hodleri]